MKNLFFIVFICISINLIYAQEKYFVRTDIIGTDTVYQTSNIKMDKISGVVKDGFFEIGLTKGKDGTDYSIYIYVIEDLKNYFVISKSKESPSLIISADNREIKLITTAMQVVDPETCMAVYFVEKEILTQISKLSEANILLKGIGRNCEFLLTSDNISNIQKFLKDYSN